MNGNVRSKTLKRLLQTDPITRVFEKTSMLTLNLNLLCRNLSLYRTYWKKKEKYLETHSRLLIITNTLKDGLKPNWIPLQFSNLYNTVPSTKYWTPTQDTLLVHLVNKLVTILVRCLPRGTTTSIVWYVNCSSITPVIKKRALKKWFVPLNFSIVQSELQEISVDWF